MTFDYSHRRSSVKVRFTDAGGAPLAGKQVRAEMKRHEFLFGLGLFSVVPYASGEMSDPKQRERFEVKYAAWKELVNACTLPFYWGQFEPVQGQPRLTQTMAAAKWLKERGVTVKGHPLCWHTGCAPFLLTMTNEEIIKAQIDRIHRDVSYFAGVIDMWDVINEVVIMPIFDKYDNGITRICKELGRVKTVKTMFDAARESNPDATLLINDFNLSTNYQILIDGCLNAGASIDEIGLQTHMHQGYMGQEKLMEVLERYEVFGKPLHFTEISLVSGKIMPPDIVDLNDYHLGNWPSTPEGEERQARELQEMLKILFSHPLVRTAYQWESTDGGWLNAPTGILRADLSKKPSYDAMYELVRKEWWTDETFVTDENGEAVITGYRGDYELHCEGNTFALPLRKGQLDTAKTFRLK